jgi:hypothetical protein
MTAINKQRERELLGAAERGLKEAGYRVARRKFKHYTIEKDGRRQNIAVRTSADRWIGFAYQRDGWLTLGDTSIDGFVIATYNESEQPSEIIVYPVVSRSELERRFEEARSALVRGGMSVRDPRVWVCLDERSTGRVWDVGSGVVTGLVPIARYLLHAETRSQPGPELERVANEGIKPVAPKQDSISLVVDLDAEEHHYLAERYARRLEVDPARLRVEVRLTFVL